jgi:Ran GTPase-activating protein (RanGAP) involved in mRNA processing and transport
MMLFLLKVLNLELNSIRDAGLSPLCGVLSKQGVSLEELDLSWNHIDSRGARHIATLLQDTKSLKKLVLKGNNVKSDGASIIFNALRKNNSLRSLDLSSNNIRKECSSSLRDTLRNNNSLEELILRNNAIKGSCFAFLFILHFSLFCLEGALAIAEAIKETSTLLHVDLAENRIEDSVCSAVAEAVVLNGSLTKINLLYNPLSEDSLQKLRHTFARNRLVTVILEEGDL